MEHPRTSFFTGTPLSSIERFLRSGGPILESQSEAAFRLLREAELEVDAIRADLAKTQIPTAHGKF
jgi:hypothetical protein